MQSKIAATIGERAVLMQTARFVYERISLHYIFFAGRHFLARKCLSFVPSRSRDPKKM